MKREVCAVIPARGGSKGIPRKNLALLGGRPLVEHSIRAALECARVDRVVVSTDDREIAAVSRASGADVPFLRPAHLSGDSAVAGDAVAFTIGELRRREGYRPTHVLELYPTTPFRTGALLDEALESVFGRYETAISVKSEWISRFGLLSSEEGAVRNLSPNVADTWVHVSAASTRAMDLRHLGPDLKPTVPLRESFRRRAQGDPKFRYSLRLVEARHPAELIDIDTPEDLELAEEVLREGLFAA